MERCKVEGCKIEVSKPGYDFCLNHWKAHRANKVIRCPKCQQWHDQPTGFCQSCDPSAEPASPQGLLSATRIGEFFNLSSVKINLILAELGWIEKYVKGWVPTDRGNALGANVREMRNGTPFVVWPESILKNAALNQSINEQSLTAAPAPQIAAQDDKSADFRSKFPATHRTQDGHMVRSRAEVIIDNWLYVQGIVHAYERRLPIEEECYCDFYLPGGKVYIEFWGKDSDPKYRDRKTIKQALYKKYNLRLIELGDAEIERIDDVLPKALLRFGIDCA